MLKFGVVTQVDPAACRVRVQYQDNEGLESWWLAVLQRKTLEDRDYHMPAPGEHVACLVDAHNEEGVVLGAIYSAADPTPVQDPETRHLQFKDGTEIEYDRTAHALRANVQGTLETSARLRQALRVDQGNLLIKLVGERPLPTEPPDIVPSEDWKKPKGHGYVVIESENMIVLNAPRILFLSNAMANGAYVKDLIEDEVFSEAARK